MTEELQVLRGIAEKLNEAGIDYMISGSVAMNYYAQPRMTRDIDIVIALGKDDAGRFIALFENDFYLEAETVKEEVSRSGMFNIIHNQFIVKVDFIIRKSGEYDAKAFARRKQIAIEESRMWIISPEDLVLAKLRWAIESASEMQMRDVRNILSAGDDLDEEYMCSWAERLGVEDALKKARHER